MKWSELMALGAQAGPDSDVMISRGGALTRVEPGPVLEGGTREDGRGGHVLHDGELTGVADAAVLVDQETGARGDVVLLPEE